MPERSPESDAVVAELEQRRRESREMLEQLRKQWDATEAAYDARLNRTWEDPPSLESVSLSYLGNDLRTYAIGLADLLEPSELDGDFKGGFVKIHVTVAQEIANRLRELAK